MSLDIFVQMAIAFTGVIAIYLSQQSNNDLKKYACLFGLVGQPFWFYSAYTSEQFGIFALCFLYTYAWATGVKAHWLKAKS